MSRRINFHVTPMSYTDDFDKVNKALNLYAAAVNLNKGKTFLRPKLVSALTFYVVYGYTKEAKEMIMESLKVNKKNVIQMNSELTKRGYLIRDVFNYKKRTLSKELLDIKDYFLDNNDSFYLMRFTKKD